MICKATGYEVLSLAIRKHSYILAKKIFKSPNALVIDEKWTDYILLIKALQRGCRQIAKLLLRKNCRVNKIENTNFYHTPLYYAVRLNDVELVQILINRGAIINKKDFNKDTPLYLAIKNKNYTIVDILLSKYLLQSTDLYSPSNDDRIAFNAACLRNNEYLVKSFLGGSRMSNKYVNFNAYEDSNSSPLHIAVKHQYLNIINILLHYGADITVKNEEGQTPLHLAYYIKDKSYPPKNCLKIIDTILCAYKKTDVNLSDNNGLSYFHIACSRGQLDIVKHFLQSKIDVNSSVHFNSPYYSGYTPLHFAIENRHQNIIRLLLDSGADIMIKNKAEETAFHLAFSSYDYDNYIIDLMLSKYVPVFVNPINSKGLSHFHIACTTDNIGSIQDFLKHGEFINICINLDAGKNPGYTPLHFAVSFNHSSVVEFLLKNKADSNAKEKNGFTPLHLACQQNDKKIHAIFRNSVDKYNILSEKLIVSKDSPEQQILNLEAQQNEQLKIIELLLMFKSEINSQDNLGRTPLFYSCDIDYSTIVSELRNHSSIQSHSNSIQNQFCIKQKRIIEILLNYKPNLDLCDNNGKTVLHYIADKKSVFGNEKAEIADMLLEHGADINIETQSGLTALHIALSNNYVGFIDLIGILLKYNVNPNIAEKKTLCTPLHLATSTDFLAPKSEEIITALLVKGADIDMTQIDGKTSLHIAASTRYSTNRLTPLLEMDCDINAQDKKGRTPLHMACVNRNAENVQNLLNHGADMNIMDRNKKTPFFYFYEFQIDVIDNRRTIYDFNHIYFIFKNHIRKLRMIDFFVSWENMTYYMKLKELHKQQTTKINEDNIFIECENEIKRMKSIKINKYSSLYDILFKDPNEMTFHINNEEFRNIFRSKSFKSEFVHYGFLLKLQLKRGLSRNNLLRPAKDAIEFLLGFRLPDSCSEGIFRFLSNKNLKDIIKAQNCLINE